MAGQLAVTARKSIPVENRSGRLLSAAGVGALVIATSQWAHWAGFADWDLLSIIPGFAQVTGLLPNAYADGRNFDCPNKTLGSEIALMSDEMLKTVGTTLCTKEELIAASLRGSDGRARMHPAALITASPETIILPITPIMSAFVPAPKVAMVHPVAPAVQSFTMASIEPVKRDPNRDLVDEITRRARQVEDVDPCSGGIAGRALAGCGLDGPGSGEGSSGGGSSDDESSPGSGSGGGSSGSGDGDGNGNEWSDGGHSGSGSDDGQGGDGGEGGGSHDNSGDYADGGGSQSGGDGHDDGDSHGGSGNGGEDSGGESHGSGDGAHDGADTHDVAEIEDGGGSDAGDASHDSGNDHLETAADSEHSGSSGESDDGAHGDSGSSSSGDEGGSGGSGSHSESGRSGGRG